MSTQTIERTTLSNLVYNEPYARKVLPFIKPEYFSNRHERVVFEEIFSISIISVFNFVAHAKRVLRAFLFFCLAIITGVFFLKIPAFSRAISSIFFPRNSIWSKPILVMIVSFLFSIIFVASSLPPRPVSIIFTSLGYLLKAIIAAAVVISKNVIGFPQ